MTPDTPAAPAPANPAPAAAPVAPAAPQSFTQTSAIDAATDAARQRLQDTGTAEPHPSSQQPRTEAGQFHKSAIKEVGVGAEEAPVSPLDVATPKVAPQAGREATGQKQATVEGEAQPEGEVTPEGAQAEGEEPIVVTLPGRNPGEEVEIEVTDKEVAERLNQLRNSAMRGDEAREYVAKASRSLEEVAEFEDMLQADPAGVVTRALSDDLDTQVHLALYLTTRPEVWARVKDRVLSLDDPTQFELTSAKLENERHYLSENFQAIASERKTVQNNLRDVRQAVASIIPAEMAEQQYDVFTRDALRDIAAYAERHNLLTINPRDIPLILAPRMAASGIDPVKAAMRLAGGIGGVGRNRSSDNGTVEGRPAANGAAALPKAPQRTGAEMVEGARRRAVAGKVPGAGAGTSSAAPAIPPFDPSKGTSAIDQALEAHRAALKAGKSVGA